MSEEYRIILPWFNPLLAANAQYKKFATSRARAKARIDGNFAARASGAKKLDWKAVDAHWTFYPPINRTHDKTNLLASMKAAQDGVADAIGIDDSKWTPTGVVIAGTVKGGQVILTIKEREE